MIKRIVKLTFRSSEIAAFRAIFEASKNAIRAREGCLHVELLRSHHQPAVFFTLSYWESEAALEAYRQSELFQNTWAQTKILFADRPEAWSTDWVSEGNDEAARSPTNPT